MINLDDVQIRRFWEDGFLVVDRLIDDNDARAAIASFDRLFRGDFEKGLLPDEVNWQDGTSAPDLTRQICNGWKADHGVAKIVLREDIGRAIARLAAWPGARIMQDNVIWKPPGAKPLGYHQDNAYLAWITPREMLSCWIALDDTTAEGGTMEVVRGSHRWKVWDPEGAFHGPTNYRDTMLKAAAWEGIQPEIVPIVVPRGGGAFHHGGTWHGSGFNRTERPRRSLVIHGLSSKAAYVRENIGFGNGPIYGRYMRLVGAEMDENYFPILWAEDGGRTPQLDAYLALHDRS